MNNHLFTKRSIVLLFFTAFLGSFSVAAAASSANHQVINDVDVYFAVIPAEITQGYSGMQAGVKKHETRYHIIVSLFDAPTGKRIADAKVEASVNAISGMMKQYKTLEPMFIMDAASYGNYFIISEPGKYRLRFKVLTPARKYEITAEFLFDRPKD